MKRLLPLLMGFIVLLFNAGEGWSLPPCPADKDFSHWIDCYDTSYTSLYGDKYVGEWKDGKFHGQGIYHPCRRKT